MKRVSPLAIPSVLLAQSSPRGYCVIIEYRILSAAATNIQTAGTHLY
jgi:hypothetical protein